MSDINKTLEKRRGTHGSFESTAKTAQAIKSIIDDGDSNELLLSFQREALHQIATKISRIVNGDPDHADSWHDIAGYATLTESLIVERAPKCE
ncbi:hypothetical protein UFOVP83_49 [uncultured Caudovirales phage]|uniref:DUF6378 domain-containing protein n=1 Tax=uncultured Caudovirales phage TaxID=2100421 RepID=A0A6J5TBA4_9CAUD|nr:hypothetical protein UFOVP83_49 [uncultured Caudovirales phage]